MSCFIIDLVETQELVQDMFHAKNQDMFHAKNHIRSSKSPILYDYAAVRLCFSAVFLSTLWAIVEGLPPSVPEIIPLDIVE